MSNFFQRPHHNHLIVIMALLLLRALQGAIDAHRDFKCPTRQSARDLVNPQRRRSYVLCYKLLMAIERKTRKSPRRMTRISIDAGEPESLESPLSPSPQTDEQVSPLSPNESGAYNLKRALLFGQDLAASTCPSSPSHSFFEESKRRPLPVVPTPRTNFAPEKQSLCHVAYPDFGCRSDHLDLLGTGHPPPAYHESANEVTMPSDYEEAMRAHQDTLSTPVTPMSPAITMWSPVGSTFSLEDGGSPLSTISSLSLEELLEDESPPPYPGHERTGPPCRARRSQRRPRTVLALTNPDP